MATSHAYIFGDVQVSEANTNDVNLVSGSIIRVGARAICISGLRRSSWLAHFISLQGEMFGGYNYRRMEYLTYAYLLIIVIGKLYVIVDGRYG